MKKSLLFGIVSLVAAAAASFGQGYITLDNYYSGNHGPGTMPVYGPEVLANGVSGPLGEIGTGLSSAWTVGLYWAAGVTGLSQGSGYDLPDPSLALGTGIGSTTQVAGPSVGGQPGFFSSFAAFNTGSTLNTMITLEIVVYPTAAGSYSNAPYRLHSPAFSMPTVSAASGDPAYTGAYMPPGAFFWAVEIPEPAALALGGLGFAALTLFHRKKILSAVRSSFAMRDNSAN